MKLSVRMVLDKGRDRMTAQQAVRIARLTEAFDGNRLTLDGDGRLDSILNALEQLAAAVEEAKADPPPLLRVAT